MYNILNIFKTWVGPFKCLELPAKGVNFCKNKTEIEHKYNFLNILHTKKMNSQTKFPNQ